MSFLTRRQSFALFGWTAALLLPMRVLAQGQDIIAEFTGGKTPAAGRVELDIPFTADNANSVPVGIRVDSPMTAEKFCSEILLIAEKNPRPKVCSFKFEPGLSVPHLSTRIRLAESQTVQAFAKMNDGSVFVSRKAVTVTTGACAPGG
jgi:sulfur-oxidizing protein SoxY